MNKQANEDSQRQPAVRFGHRRRLGRLTPHGTGRTDVGRVRDRNEDTFVADDAGGLYIVSDGMGGHAAGEIASELASSTVARVVLSAPLPATRQGSIELLSTAVERANRAVFERGQSTPNLRGMGCTLTAVRIMHGSCQIAHVGDSRCYLWRGGKVAQLTADHTLVAEYVAKGLGAATDERIARCAHLLSRAIGSERVVEVDRITLDLEEGDRLLLCSDGLTQYASPARLAHQLAHPLLDGIPRRLIAFANARGGVDNVTALVVDIAGDVPSSRGAHVAGTPRSV